MTRVIPFTAGRDQLAGDGIDQLAGDGIDQLAGDGIDQLASGLLGLPTIKRMAQTGRLLFEGRPHTTDTVKYKRSNSTRGYAETVLDLVAAFTQQVCRVRHRPIKQAPHNT